MSSLQKKVFLLIFAVFYIFSPVVNAQGESWTWIKVEDNVNLQSVDMVNSIDGWAVGSEGTIVNWDGIRWNKISSPTTANLRAVDVVGANEVYAIASIIANPIDESLIRWDGANWNNIASPTGAWLTSVDMISSTDGWIVATDGIYRWQEVTAFPTGYFLIIIGFVIAVIIACFVIRKKIAHAQSN